MARKKYAGRANHERWLVSYADFITLLFALFVVLFASSQTDKAKAQKVSDSIQRAFDRQQFSAVLTGILGGARGVKQQGNLQMKGPGGAKPTPVPTEAEGTRFAELIPSIEVLRELLSEEIETGMLKVSMEPRGLVVSLRQAAFFPPGADAIDEGTYPTIAKLAAMIVRLPNKVRLEGHTDNIPIRTAKYRSNWELSSARGVTMLELLQNRFAIPASRMSVGGYAETIPVDSNETAAGRAHNRRVDIVILNEKGLREEPEASKKPT